MTADDLLTRLAAPFPPTAISWRIGSMNADKTKGMALAYIDARDVQDRLNDACGLLWQVRHPWSSGSLIACEIGILVESTWVWRGDGAGESEVDDGLSGPRKEQQQDMVRKAAFSDSFKRAAVRWGIGRYLYDLPAIWVTIEQRGRSYILADAEFPRLRASLSKIQPAATEASARPAAAPPPRAVPRYTQSEAKQMKLSEIRDGIQQAILAADSVERIDRIIKNHEQDLGLLRDAHAPTYNMLLSLAAGQKGELMNAAAHAPA